MIRALLFLTLITLFPSNSKAGEDRPNILFIFADDLGYEMLGCYGGQTVKTPYLDQLASEGMKFSRCYTSPVCTPSRMSVYTGKYAIHHGYYNVLPVHLGTKKAVNFSERPTYAQQLRKAGYETSVTGKWQLATLEFHPDHCRSAGFDSWCLWQIWREGAKTTRYWNPCLNHDGNIRNDISDRFGPDVLADYVIDQMKAAVENDRPFCIHHNMMLPHWPISQTPNEKTKGQPASLEAMVVYLDQLVGRLTKAVDDLGIAENTYVIFIGDNGTDSKIPRRTNSGLVRGGKTNLNDAGMHVPMLVRKPGKIPEGTVCDQLIDTADLFPTFCELANVETSELNLDGVSFADVLDGEGTSSRSWVTGGYGNDFVVFDGQFRLHRKTGKLIDCRRLPEESPAEDNDPEAKTARKKLEAVLNGLGS
ncbi:sulfatase-like hydrolase/transferase [Rubinisphaera italica]|uniref:Arylsulfatase n=1 Tax=Rubinisphaera italica TaxID=2527969 RepID=A0A5C5XQ27_9PLAN|nr:sulfatase-like hydrolase/transferase [Rubinisphaera italica]TWT64175.1 Arylsulfatase [Rubinisphaera italica]